MLKLDESSSRRIISFSLYGTLPIYMDGAIRNAELAPHYYPNWIPRFYVDASVPQEVISRLTDLHSEIIFIDTRSLGPMYGRYWRFWVAAEPQVERFLVRDVDSLLNSREQAAVAEWIGSGKSFHIMRDSIDHRTRMLGGMWGGVGGVLPDIRELIDSWGRYSQHGECDRFASEVIFPRMSSDYICHDSSGYFDDGLPFPPHAPLEGTSFVGERITAEMRSMDVWRRLGEKYDEILRLRHEFDNLRQRFRNLDQQGQLMREERQQLIETLKMPSASIELRFALRIARYLRHARLLLRRMSLHRTYFGKRSH